MCHESCIEFGREKLIRELINGKDVIEVGSFNVNGSLREMVLEHGPAYFIGVDMQEGPGVDSICNAVDLIDRFGIDRFDVVINTEMMEHAEDWRLVIHNLKGIVKPSGLLLITTRSKGFPFHGYPDDFWRYEIDDMFAIFSDFNIESLRKDPLAHGVFMIARKPQDFVENDLSSHELYSIKTELPTP